MLRRLIPTIIAALTFGFFPSVGASASTASSTILTTIYAGQTSLCTAQLGASICNDLAVPTSFGEGALGWPGRQSGWGGPFVEPSSFGFVTASGQEFNVYEPLSSTLVDSLKWLLPWGVDPQAFAIGIYKYNVGWGTGDPIIVPN